MLVKNFIRVVLPFNLTRRNMSDTIKPSFPSTYTVPTVWSPPTSAEGKFASVNLPTAGAQQEAVLPKGEHILQLYSLGTPNGHKVTILLEELGIDYDAYKVNIFENEQFGSEFVDINPNSKIPALLDNSLSPPLRIFESGSMLHYLAEKEGKFIPKDIRKKTECMNWLMWQMGTAPYLGGGFGHFYNYAPMKIEYAIDRFSMETKRILDVLDKHLEGKDFVCDDEYSIADMAIFPWIRCLSVFYNATDFLQLETYKNVQRWMTTIAARPAVQRGLRVNGFSDDAIKERHSLSDFDDTTTDA
jgi:GST-like protein